ncbi:hypothetical protein [Adhaeribacter soli]|uniref:Type II secretion system protein GspC N-terminal domain-containing protein n=1 Tax=Adhaeribacter soli TaxID=2607655 RepID=A0A5N1IN62_9BACT|nr:hypothetical protein [Adhaeribacter soli]KAA9324920.1 hypothetical protein F0P94_19535 [Adhaeribacter soli]
MKNKKLVYILLPLVLIIWGLIVYQVKTAIADEPEVIGLSNEKRDGKLSQEIQQQEFSLMLNYPDPFLKGEKVTRTASPAQANRVSSRQKPNPVLPPVQLKEEIAWPNIVYNGMIVNQNSNAKIAMLTIGEQQVFLKINSIEKGIRLLRIYKDSVRVELNGQRKAIIRN